jgi:hypothetical protein
MNNPWLAIDVATAPVARARELRRAWERFVGDEDGADADRGAPATGTATMRPPIVDSWPTWRR